VLEIEFALHDLIGVDLLAMCPCPLLPSGDGSFVQFQRMDNGLHRTSIGEKRYDHDDQFFGFASPNKHCPLARAERFATRLTFVPLTLLPMADQIASSDLPSCRGVQIGAK
jgi:hypothetical protein